MGLVCDRRGLLRGIAATALGGAWAYPASAQARRDAPDAGKLPPKGEYLLKGAFVMTMDPQLGNISKGSVHVKDGEIVDVDAAISAPGAEVIDADGMIVLPGLVETHWHRWSSLLRSMAIGE